MSACMDCGKNLTYNEIGAYKKFVNRGSRSFLCKQCLAQKLDVTIEDIDRKIEQFKQQGLLFYVSGSIAEVFRDQEENENMTLAFLREDI